MKKKIDWDNPEKVLLNSINVFLPNDKQEW